VTSRMRFWLVAVTACSTSAAPAVDPGWMASIDDARSLADLSIPGTHESAALYEPLAGTAKCQNLTLADQLAAGVRYFDIRCRDLSDAFAIFHGPIDEQQTFDDVLATMTDFLDAHPSETVIMSIKEESDAESTTRSYEQTFVSYVDPDRWYLGDTVPALGDVRGKIVLLRRFAAASTPLGIDASGWADDTTFSIDNAASLRVQDAYQVSDDAAKWQAITALLAEARAADGTTLYLDYTSGYQLHAGIPDTPSVADTINPQLDGVLTDPATAGARLGVLAMDFVDQTRAMRVASTNLP